jgi:low temperature requirement protein LtrA
MNVPARPLRIPMVARSTSEHERTATPLELLFDLVFVVAIAQLVAELAHAIADAHSIEAIAPFLMVFFAIWWAWMNFTWFASAYDTDDVPYRLLVLVQMAGLLVIAAGVPTAFASQDFTAMVIGYVIMRAGLISLWLRAAAAHPEGRATALRYASGITAVQLLWVARIAFPVEIGFWSWIVLAFLDLMVPFWAEHARRTPWHPRHIAERFGLFTIILLGESVLAAIRGVQLSVSESGVSAELVLLGLAALVLLFALWWLYFAEPAAEGLIARRDRVFAWGYGHGVVFAALAATGAGLEVAVESGGHAVEQSPVGIAFAVTIPVAVFLVALWAVHAPLGRGVAIRPTATFAAAALLLLLPLVADQLGPAGSLWGMVLVVCALLTLALVDGDRAHRNRLRTDAGAA